MAGVIEVDGRVVVIDTGELASFEAARGGDAVCDPVGEAVDHAIGILDITPDKELRPQLVRRGVLVPKDGPEAAFTVTIVEPGRRTVMETELPGGALVIDRTVSVESGRTVFVHDVRFEGPSAPLFSFLLGDRYRRALPAVMQQVRARAEAAAAPTPP